MTNKYLIISVICLLVFSCKNKGDSSTKEATVSQSATPAPKVLTQILGSFVGTFGDNKIALLITKAVGDTLQGRTVVGGNDRPFDGTVTVNNGVYTIVAKEPGDHKNDGTFNFTIKDANLNLIEGSWVANASPSIKKEYVLQKKSFAYDINVGNYPEASQKILKEADVENLGKWDLEQMRNEIFARHGYCFKKKELRQAFESKEWYVPHTTNVVADLTAVEKKNIELIKRYEKYQEFYGDEFGR